MSRRGVVHCAVALTGALGLVLVLVLSGHPVRPLWFVAAALAGAAVTLGWRELGGRLAETVWPQRDAELPMPRGSESRVRFMATWLREATRTPYMYGGRIQPVLAEIVAARLRRGHGIDLTAQPDAARAVLGDWLWRLLNAPGDRVVSYRELVRAVDETERI